MGMRLIIFAFTCTTVAAKSCTHDPIIAVMLILIDINIRVIKENSDVTIISTTNAMLNPIKLSASNGNLQGKKEIGLGADGFPWVRSLRSLLKIDQVSLCIDFLSPRSESRDAHTILTNLSLLKLISNTPAKEIQKYNNTMDRLLEPYAP